MSRFFISDMHFGHEAIIKYANRPFSGVEEMDETIIKNWNNTVNHGDEVFILGDVSFYCKEKTEEVLHKLKGRKYLLIGNHDRFIHAIEWGKLGVGITVAIDKPVIIDEYYILSHEPVYLNQSMPYVNIHGHLHDNTISTGGSINQYINVSVEQINYTPISFEEIKKRLQLIHTL